MNRDFYKILVVGNTGMGKTYLSRTMDPNTTGFINIENKPLPFKNTFKYHSRPNSALEAYNTIIEYAKNPEINCIIVDSFSAYSDLILADARRTKKGFEIWSEYNESVAKFNDLIKKVPKEVIVTAHYELLNIEGAPEKRVKLFAKQWEGVFEKDYTIVMYANNRYVDGKDRPEHYLQLTGEGISAKCPPDIFGEDVTTIPNDGKYILEKVLEFVN